MNYKNLFKKNFRITFHPLLPSTFNCYWSLPLLLPPRMAVLDLMIRARVRICRPLPVGLLPPAPPEPPPPLPPGPEPPVLPLFVLKLKLLNLNHANYFGQAHTFCWGRSSSSPIDRRSRWRTLCTLGRHLAEGRYEQGPGRSSSRHSASWTRRDATIGRVGLCDRPPLSTCKWTSEKKKFGTLCDNKIGLYNFCFYTYTIISH